MSTMEPEVIEGGSRIEGNSILGFVSQGRSGVEGLTMRLSSVRRTAMPASTLPTVSDTSILEDGLEFGGLECCLRNLYDFRMTGRTAPRAEISGL
jgi:hypothetical protein